jgi:nitrite reductase (NADH) small subunit
LLLLLLLLLLSSPAKPDADGFYFACSLSALPIKKGVKIKLNKKSLAVFRLADGTIFAMENTCTHQGAPLACGTLYDIEDTPHVKCPGHNVKFNLLTGKANRGKWVQKTFATLVKRDELWIKL